MATAVCILDTSVFCNILEVPDKCQHQGAVIKELEAKIKASESILLPLAAIVETGNHIAQRGDGRVRRQCAERFVKQVRGALEGQAPWTPTFLPDAEQILSWLAEFPDGTMRGEGFGDLSIIKEFHRQCELHRARRVYIWSLDGHLQSYSRESRL